MAEHAQTDAGKLSFAWDPAWDTGNPAVDRQHRQLLQQMERLATAASTGLRNGETERALMLLGEYVETHFRDEESLMLKACYPEFASHKELHDDLRRQAYALVADFLERMQPLPASVMAFLVGWLKEHLAGADRRLADYLREH